MPERLPERGDRRQEDGDRGRLLRSHDEAVPRCSRAAVQNGKDNASEAFVAVHFELYI